MVASLASFGGCYVGTEEFRHGDLTSCTPSMCVQELGVELHYRVL